MKSRQTPLLVGLAVTLLLGASAILGYVFFGMLQSGLPGQAGGRPGSLIGPGAAGQPGGAAGVVTASLGAAGAEGAGAPGAGFRGAGQRPVSAAVFDETMSVIGPGGEERKYAHRSPTAPPPPGTAGATPTPRAEEKARKVETARTYAQMPLSFEPQCDQPSRIFDFNRKGSAYDLEVAPGEIILRLHRPELQRDAEGRAEMLTCDERKYDSEKLPEELVLRMKLYGADQGARGLAGEEFAAPERHIVGADPRAWFTDVPRTRSVKYADIYPGIDLLFYGDESRFEFMFLARYGADVSRISYTFEGTDKMALDEYGNMLLRAEAAKIVTRRPLAYEVIDNVPYLLDAGYTLQDGNARVSVRPRQAGEAAPPERPVFDYLSFLGGKGADRACAVAVDGNGCAYVAGSTGSSRFPAAGGEERPDTGDESAFVTKFRIADSQPIYTAFLGGGAADHAFGIAVAPDGAAYVCGETLSSDFPAVGAAGGGRGGRAWDAFLVKLKPDGSGADFALRFGGRGDDRAYGVGVDGQTNVYLAGETLSPDFPVSNGLAGARSAGGWDGFVAKFDRAGRLLSSSRIGGSGDDSIHAVAVEPEGAVYVAGETSSSDFPLANAFQKAHGGGTWDAFVARIGRPGTFLDFSTYLGGANDDRARGVASDMAGQVYVAGDTASGDFPMTNAVQPYYAGGQWDMFVAKLERDGSRPVYSTLLGGSGDDCAFAVGADVSGNATVAGGTTSSNWMTLEAVQGVHGGGEWDGFVAKLDAGGRAAYSSYLGGPGDDVLYGLTVDPARGAHVAGSTASPELPTVNPLQKDFHGGKTDALLAKIPAGRAADPDLKLVPGGGQPGGPEYDFFMQKCEVTNEEFTRFLNDAQANPGNARGANMFFDAAGDVWLSPAMLPERDEMFAVSASRIAYRPDYPLGTRYAVSPAISPVGGSYSNHPVVGVTWYGSLKYCNWLTIDTGRGADQRCYREGTNTIDWSPVASSRTNWNRGFFTPSEREMWLKRKGFRLPMDNCWGRESRPNAFNEFYKAAAWCGNTNMPYAFGRETVEKGDANFLDNGLFQKHDTTPVGFSNGSDHGGRYLTHSNLNFYGIFDLSGNAMEWLNDPGNTNVLTDRGCYGGSWMFDLPQLSERSYVSPHFSDRFRGFRVVTTAAREQMLLIRVPYYICLCGHTRGEKKKEEEAVEAVKKTELEVKERRDVPIGVIYEEKEKPEEEEEEHPKKPKKPKKKPEVPTSPSGP